MSIGPRTPADEPKPPRHSEPLLTRLRNRALNIVEVVVIVAVLSFLLGLLGEVHFVFDLASHFRVQAGIVAFVGGAVLMVFRDFRIGALALVGGAALLLSTYPYFVPTEKPSSELPAQRLLIMNVLKENGHKQDVIAYLHDQDPDVIVLFETDPAWESALSPALAERWPYQKTIPLEGHYGLCLYSKTNWSSAKQRSLTEYQIPAVDVQWQPGDGPAWRLIGTHATAPLGTRAWRTRNQQFDEIAELVEAGDGTRTIFVGDLNCTPWAPKFKNFVKRTQLRDAAHGQQLKFTWHLGAIPWVGLPIDHVLVGSNVGIVSHRVGPPLGSDHRSVVVDFAIGETN